MKKFSYHISFSVFLILIITSLCLAEQSSGSRIFFEEKIFDAKEIKSADYLEHTFKVQNKGDSPLNISVKPG